MSIHYLAYEYAPNPDGGTHALTARSPSSSEILAVAAGPSLQEVKRDLKYLVLDSLVAMAARSENPLPEPKAGVRWPFICRREVEGGKDWFQTPKSSVLGKEEP